MKKQSNKNLAPQKGNGEKFRNISIGLAAITRGIVAIINFFLDK